MLATLLDSIRTRERELALSKIEAYHQAIRKLAEGQELDVEFVASLLDELGKSEEQFEADIENQRRRFELGQQLERKKEIDKQILRLEREFEAADQRIKDAQTKLRDDWDQAYRPLKAAQDEKLSYLNVEDQLIRTCADPRILNRKQEIDRRRMELVEQRRPIAEDFHELKRQYEYHSNRVADVERSISQEIGSTVRNALKNSKKEIQLTADRYNEQMKRVAEPLREIDDELASLNRELEDLNREALVP